MQVKMQEILNFTKTYESIKDQKMPIKTVYKFTKLAKAIEAELNFYYEKIQNIIQEYGLRDENNQIVPLENGEGIKLQPGMEKECISAMNELESIEVTLPDVSFSMEEFANIELTFEEMNILFPFIEE